MSQPIGAVEAFTIEGYDDVTEDLVTTVAKVLGVGLLVLGTGAIIWMWTHSPKPRRQRQRPATTWATEV